MLKTFARLKEYAATGEGFVHLSDGEMARLHSVLVDMLADFHRLCSDHGLTYMLTGGSALGAARCGGIIPWDDDIDIAMPRADYEQLAGIVAREYADRYWVQSLATSEKCDLNFIKLRKLGTKYVELYEPEPEKAGICLDIFPLDDAPDNPLVRVLHGLVDEALFLAASCVRMYQKRERLLKHIKDERLSGTIRLKCLLGRLLSSRKAPRKWYFRCESWCRRLNDPNSRYLVVSCGRGHYFGELYERSKILPPSPTVFQGQESYLPGDNHHLLSVLYGENYLKVPDDARRETHALLELSFGPEE